MDDYFFFVPYIRKASKKQEYARPSHFSAGSRATGAKGFPALGFTGFKTEALLVTRAQNELQQVFFYKNGYAVFVVGAGDMIAHRLNFPRRVAHCHGKACVLQH